MPHERSRQGQLDMGDALAVFALQYGLTKADLAEHGMGPRAGAFEANAAAVVADVRGHQARLQPRQLRLRLLQLRLGLVKLRLKHLGFRLGLCAQAFKLCQLRPYQREMFAKDVRAAAFVDELLKQFQWVHGWPVSLKPDVAPAVPAEQQPEVRDAA